MRVYIAGRVTNLPYDDVKKKFEAAETLLQIHSYEPISPLKYVNQDAKPDIAMSILLPIMLTCDAVFTLHDWEQSEGAQIEVQLARYCGMPLINEEDLT